MLDKLSHPAEFGTDRDAWTKHSAKERNFMHWKKQIKLIDDAISQTGAAGMQDMGKVMGILKPQLQGRADMGAASGKVRAKLN